MKTGSEDYSAAETYYKLVALWAVCEAFAGGLLHAVKMPFSGMIISSLAVMSISLIGRFCPGRLKIIKATLIVCIFKLMLSPHSPPTAYFAVAFQGLMGQLLFWPGFSVAGSVALGFFALTESAVQRILVMILLYGASFWEAVNAFLKKNFDPSGSHNYLYSMAALYIGLHALLGIACGLFASYLARNTEKWRGQYGHLMIDPTHEEEKPNEKAIKIKRFRLLGWIGWLLLLLLYIQAKSDPVHAILPVSRLSDIFFRAFIIIAGWFLIISPLLMWALKKILSAGQSRLKNEVRAVLALIPQTKHIFKESFRMSASVAGPERIIIFFRILVINVMR